MVVGLVRVLAEPLDDAAILGVYAALALEMFSVALASPVSDLRIGARPFVHDVQVAVVSQLVSLPFA